MAEGNGDGRPGGPAELLLHPELLSQDFLRLTLEQKNIPVESALNDKQKLTDIYVQHVIPLPQRNLPKSRWGKMMEEKREESVSPAQQNKSPAAQQGLRKRPLIVFDGSSTRTSIKVKKENDAATDRLKPPPSGSPTNTIRRLSLSPSNSLSHASTLSPPRDSKMETNPSEARQSSVPVTHSNSSISSRGITVVKLKRVAPKEELESSDDTKPSEAKKKIQHVTWP